MLAGIWVRNGLQIKGQAMTYIQANFCNSMVDMDLFFLQVCATQLPASFFLTSCIESFGVEEWFFGNMVAPVEMEHDQMMEGMLIYLATLISSRSNLGNDEDMKCIVEISALLATSDKTHSQLLELMPERSGNAYARNFEKYLKQLSIYRPPPVGSENLEQGLFIPTSVVWKTYYDPLHVLLRAVHRRDFQNSMDRFSAYVQQEKKMPKSGNLWPPFRLPSDVGGGFSNPNGVLNTKVFHSMMLGILYRAVHVRNVSEQLLALAIFLLEIAVSSNRETELNVECSPPMAASKSVHSSEVQTELPDLMNCYPSNSLFENLTLTISGVSLSSPEPQNSPANYETQYDSDFEFELSEGDPMPMLIGSVDHDYSFRGPLDVALPQDLSMVRESSGASADASSPPLRAVLPLMPSEVIRTVVEYRGNPLNPPVIPTQRPMAISAPGENSNLTQNHDERPNRQNQELFYSSTTRDTISGSTLVPFNRVQPVAVPSNANMAIVPTVQSASCRRRKKLLESKAEPTPVISIDESVISLLLKLHSQLSGTLDSFSLEDNEDEDAMSDDENISVSSDHIISSHFTNLNEARVGDGPFFIGNLLRKIAKANDKCASNINEIRQKLWPNQRERQAEQKIREAREKEERTMRARERQQKLMEDFANRQKQFMATEGKMMEGIDDDEIDEEEAREKEYDCVICNRTGPSLESNPIGLVVLVESSSIVGHRRKTLNRFPLPVCDEDKDIPNRNVRLSSEFKKRAEILQRKYGTQWFLTQNICWEGGVHVQSCGHHLHLTCHESYLRSLGPMRPQNLNIEHGEFSCPVCRQLANSVLPLSPQLDRPTAVVRNPTPDQKQLCFELKDLVREIKRPSSTSKLEDAMIKAMENMTNSTRNIKKYHAEALYQSPPTSESLFSFVTSVARTNLESEVIQRGGSLCTFNEVRYRPKRECIVPLLHVLSFHVRLMINNKNMHFQNHEWTMDHAWASLCGITTDDCETPVPSYSAYDNVALPSLITDPCAQLLKFILLAPIQLDQGRSLFYSNWNKSDEFFLAYFTCIVKVMYNLLYYQVILQFCTRLSDEDCEQIIVNCSDQRVVPENGVQNLGAAMALVLNNLERCKMFREDLQNTNYDQHIDDDVDMSEGSEDENSAKADVNPEPEKSLDTKLEEFELEMQSLCLPFLRNAALLRHHMFHHELPEVREAKFEFARLVYFLELVTKSMDWKHFNASKALCFVRETELSLPIQWCQALKDSRPPHDTTKELVQSQHAVWHQPHLLALPREYERLFTVRKWHLNMKTLETLFSYCSITTSKLA